MLEMRKGLSLRPRSTVRIHLRLIGPLKALDDVTYRLHVLYQKSFSKVV